MKRIFLKVREVRGNVTHKIRVSAACLAGGAAALIGTAAQAQYTPATPTVENLFDYGALATNVLTVLGLALAAVAGVMLAVAIAMKVVRKLKGA